AGTGFQSLGQAQRPRYGSPQGGRSVTIPEDSVIAVRMDATLTSRTAHVGDTFTVTVTAPVDADGTVIIPAGSIIEGRITQVTPAKRMSRSGSIAVEFGDLVLPDGARIRLVGVLTSDDPRTRRRIDDEGRVSADTESRKVVFIGGGGALGAILGGIAGGGKGAAVGGALGAGVGLASALLLKGEEAVVPSGTAFGVQLKQPLTIHDVSGAQRNAGIDQFPTQTDDPNTGDPQTRDPRSSDGTEADPGPPDLRRTDRTVGDPLPRTPETSDSRPAPEEPAPEEPASEEPASEEPPSEEPQPEEPPAEEPAAAEPDLPLTSPEMIRKAQIALKEQGYYEGQTDGVMSARMSAALKTYQREHKLAETGQLDQQSATSLGLYKPMPVRSRAPAATPASGRTADRPRDPGSSRPVDSRTDPAGGDNVVLANVSSASASRTPDGGIRILINTQANTGGWKWFGDKVVNGDTLEVYARAVRPSGMVTQVLTRGRIELNVTDDVENVRRVVVHSNSGDQVIRLDSGSASAPAVDYDRPTATRSDVSLQRQADDLLAYYQKLCGVRLTGSGIEVDKGVKYGDAEIELLFAIDGFANAAQLYTRLTNSLRDAQSSREATLDLARQARRTDRVITTSNSRVAGSLVTRWDPIRQDVLKLMKNYNISASEIEND
ncbi:MAG TPA: peptidoglycan-binding protein, partial [Blastocatellia bacterium]|nr:peptidoglycan-binding protein [Blastocatellia bacterium]